MNRGLRDVFNISMIDNTQPKQLLHTGPKVTPNSEIFLRQAGQAVLLCCSPIWVESATSKVLDVGPVVLSHWKPGPKLSV